MAAAAGAAAALLLGDPSTPAPSRSELNRRGVPAASEDGGGTATGGPRCGVCGCDSVSRSAMAARRSGEAAAVAGGEGKKHNYGSLSLLLTKRRVGGGCDLQLDAGAVQHGLQVQRPGPHARQLLQVGPRPALHAQALRGKKKIC